ncbi:MAG: DUF5103 domain-containing protein [Flavobacteriaceae bacterium]|nr:DUF5103 domain-containing protein [Flavobacteriaceae bacterium]
MNKITLLVVLFLTITYSFSQVNIEKLPPDNIKTIIIKNPQEEDQIPIIKLGNLIELHFDDINGDEADYYYKIEHYNFDWTKSILMKSEYLQGIDDQHIQQYENSFNTLQMYSHYVLKIPNRDVRLIKTGNYLLKIYDDEENLVFSKRFILYEDKTFIAPQIKRSRDLDFINETQIVQFSIKSPNEVLINPKQTVKTLVIQNNDLDNSINDLIPQYTIGGELIYRYDAEARFWASNEFFYFDNKEIRASNQGVNFVELGELYNHYLFVNPSRTNQPYTYNPDINGDFVVNNLDADDNNTEADYVKIHFKLENYEDLTGKKVHVYGGFNGYRIDESTEMLYNKSSGYYENTQLIKQGFTNYKYIVVDENNEIDYSLVDGNFYETENDYHILVYYRPLGARYDQVIGYVKGTSVNISN